MTREDRDRLKASVEAAIDALIRRNYPEDEVLDAFESMAVYRKKVRDQERARARRAAVEAQVAAAGSQDPAGEPEPVTEPKRPRKTTNGVHR